MAITAPKTDFNMAINTSGMAMHLHHHIHNIFSRVERKKTSIPLTAAVLKNFSELASDTWKRGEWNEQNIT